jgi:cytochrome c oxidase subunit 2
LGLDWNDSKTHDDIVLGGSDRIVLPVDTMIRVRITSKDVLHNFYLPHFRVKMDAVPGLPTYFIFTPVKTTKDFREQLRQYPEWNVPFDPNDPDSKMRWEEFNFELACAELCGTGHYSMKRIVEIVTREEYETWLASQASFYQTNIRNTDADPFKGKALKSDPEKVVEQIEGSSGEAEESKE